MRTARPIVALTLLATAGCLVASTTTTKVTGSTATPGTFDHIVPGTTSGWVRANLGEPTTRTAQGADEVWRYDRNELTAHYDFVLLLYFNGVNTDRATTMFVEFDKGVVTGKWRG